MFSENQVLALDAGNTSIKIGYFNGGKLEIVKRFDIESVDDLKSWANKSSIDRVVISSVLNVEDTKSLAECFKHPLIITSETPLPIKNQYLTPETLGIDRIANACYANSLNRSKYSITIDIGTCVKFDVTHSSHGYLGGSIAPGISLRYKSLNDYTGNLPLLDDHSKAINIGQNTNQSIHSGVMNGLECELQQLINQYDEQFDDLTFFMTGGDASFFDLHSKNDIFADENLTLKGLYEIYKFNA